jgi:hypothetical protein
MATYLNIRHEKIFQRGSVTSLTAHELDILRRHIKIKSVPFVYTLMTIKIFEHLLFYREKLIKDLVGGLWKGARWNSTASWSTFSSVPSCTQRPS